MSAIEFSARQQVAIDGTIIATFVEVDAEDDGYALVDTEHYPVGVVRIARDRLTPLA